MSPLMFDVRILAGDVSVSAMHAEGRRQRSVTLIAFSPVTLDQTGTVFDACRAVVIRVYPKAGAAFMSSERRKEIEARDAFLCRAPHRFFHPCETALAGPVLETFSNPYGLRGGWAIGLVLVRDELAAVTSGAIEHLLPKSFERYFGPLNFRPMLNEPVAFAAKRLDPDLIVKRLWETVTVVATVNPS